MCYIDFIAKTSAVHNLRELAASAQKKTCYGGASRVLKTTNQLMDSGINRQITYFLRDYKHGKTLALRYLKLINSATYSQEKAQTRAKRPNPKFQEGE